jgi:hypothetical protein
MIPYIVGIFMILWYLTNIHDLTVYKAVQSTILNYMIKIDKDKNGIRLADIAYLLCESWLT